MDVFMARAKMYCIGRNKDGSQCKNWALRNSYYCASHQIQETNVDRDRMKSVQNWTGIIIVLFLVFIFLISSAAGCEDQFFKWLTK